MRIGRVSASESGPDPREQEAAQSLSQFAARVLNQLSVSAWLPAAALVLTAAFLLQLGSVLDRASEQQRDPQVATAAAWGSRTDLASPPATASPSGAGAPQGSPGPGASPSAESARSASAAPTPLPRPDEEGRVLQTTLSTLTEIGFGGVVVLIVLIVVMTMLTQSFAFEAIRVLEGYWGPFLPLEWLTDLCSLRFCWTARYLNWRRGRLLQAAVVQVECELRKEEKARLDVGEEPFFTEVRLGHLRRHIVEEEELDDVDDRTRRWVRNHPWRRDLKATTSRRLTNVETRLRDYPDPTRVLPTRLGNVIRRHEDNTGERNLESFVQRVWSRLPFSLQVQHDEYRARLDLYCTMVFVFPVLAALAVVRLYPYRPYAITAVVVMAVLCWWIYRAGIASARAWGQTLELIAAYAAAQDEQSTPPGVTARTVDETATVRSRPWWTQLVPKLFSRREGPV